jgi:hypothetical protein
MINGDTSVEACDTSVTTIDTYVTCFRRDWFKNRPLEEHSRGLILALPS